MDPNAYLLDPRIQQLLTELRGQPGIFNAARREAANRAALGLTNAGLFENVGTAEQSADSGIEGGGTNLSFALVMGPQGRLYRQNFMDVTNSFAARGGLFGSNRNRAQATGQQALDQQANEVSQTLSDAMSSSLRDQGERQSGINRSIAETKFTIGESEAAKAAAKAEEDRKAAEARDAAAVAARPPRARDWIGTNAPNVASLTKSWGVPASRIRTRVHPGTGKWHATYT